MKKITLFLFSVVAFASASKAQAPVNANDFTANPDNYKGMTISISGVEINTAAKTQVAAAAVASGSTVSKGAGVSAATSTIRCNVPKGYKVANVNFPNDPNFKACFIMKSSLYATLPLNQSAINAKITFKGETKLGFIITLVKL
jgi:hypothetical protein